MSIYEQHLDKNTANHVPLSPVSFVERSAEVFGDLPAVIHGQRRYTWAQVRERSARLAAALAKPWAWERGDTVSVMLPNTPEMVEVHYAVPATQRRAQHLEHPARRGLAGLANEPLRGHGADHRHRVFAHHGAALKTLREVHGRQVVVIDVCDSEYTGAGERVGSTNYEEWLAAHAPLAQLHGPTDEWDAIAVSYTSRAPLATPRAWSPTTAAPTSTRCATRPLGPCRTSRVTCGPCRCSIAMAGAFRGRWPCWAGTHVCLRKVDAPSILQAMREHDVNHYCAAPIVHNLIIQRRPCLARGHHRVGCAAWWLALRRQRP
jgi:fatty-acyl-CoA synthase